MARIFLSHSSKDNEAAANIKDRLDTLPFTWIFLDFDRKNGIKPGADWEKTLYTELECAQAMVILQTSSWATSAWCFAEFVLARALGKQIFQLILEPCGKTAIGGDLYSIDLTRDRDAGLDSLKDALFAIGQTGPAGFKLERDTSPFPGLTAFDTDQAAVFFGRNDEIRDGLDRLRAVVAHGDPRFLVVLGASGSGKSSLLRAGLIPRLKRDRLNWIVLDPIRPGTHPAWTLTERLILATGADHAAQHDGWRAALAGVDAGTALAGITRALRQRHASALEATILLPVDQLEEVFTLSDAAEKAGFFRLLTALLTQDLPVAVIATMRADHLEALATASERLATPALLHLPPMPVARIEELIRGPARVAGLTVEDSLVSTLQYDARTANALPLVAFALNRLYESKAQASGRLTLADYEALGPRTDDVPPLVSAIRTHAEMIITTPALSTEAETALREAFISCLARVSSDSGTIIRRPAPRHTLPAAALPSIDRLIDARLLISAPGDGGGTVIEVSHEALLTAWPRIARWLDEEHDYLLGRERLRQVFEHWKTLPETDKPRALLTGLLLDRARTWLKTHPGRFADPAEAGFVKASVDAAVRTRTRRGLGLSVLLTAFVLAFAGFVQSHIREIHATEQASRNLFAIIDMSNIFTFEVANDLIGTKNQDIAIYEIFPRILALIDYLGSKGENHDTMDYIKGSISHSMSLYFLEIREIEKAISNAHNSVNLARTLSNKHINEPLYKSSLAISLNHLGSILLRRDPNAAKSFIYESLSIIRELAHNEPEELTFKEVLFTSTILMGDVVYDSDRQAARILFDEALSIARELVRMTPDNPKYQGQLIRALHSVGDMVKMTDIYSARAFYDEALKFSRTRSSKYIQNTHFKKSVADSTLRMFSIIRHFDPNAALNYIEEEINIRRNIIRESPHNFGYKGDIIYTLNYAGEILSKIDQDRARIYIDEALRTEDELSRKDPDNISLKQLRSVSMAVMGDILLKTDPAAARARYDEALAITRELMSVLPRDAGTRHSLAILLANIGDAMRRTDSPGARRFFDEALAIKRELAGVEPDNIQFQVGLAVGLCKAGLNEESPKIYFTEALEILQSLNAMGYLPIEEKKWIGVIENYFTEHEEKEGVV